MPHKGMLTGENSGKYTACSKYSIIIITYYLNYLIFLLAKIFCPFFIKYYFIKIQATNDNKHIRKYTKYLIQCRCWGWAHCKCHSYDGIGMEVICIRHHHDASDCHYCSNYLSQRMQRKKCLHWCLHIPRASIWKTHGSCYMLPQTQLPLVHHCLHVGGSVLERNPYTHETSRQRI